MERHTISKCEIVCSCRRQNRDNIWAVFSGVYALRYVMDSRTISKGEVLRKARKCRKAKIKAGNKGLVKVVLR